MASYKVAACCKEHACKRGHNKVEGGAVEVDELEGARQAEHAHDLQDGQAMLDALHAQGRFDRSA